MLKKWYDGAVRAIVNLSIKHPVRMVLATIVLTLPTLYFVFQITIDTNLIKLLPNDNLTARRTKELQSKIGDGGQFIVLYEGNNPEDLKAAVKYSAEKISKIEGIRSVQYKYPVDFIKKYKYLLIPNDYLNDLYDIIVRSEAKANPFSDDLSEEEQPTQKNKTHGQEENEQDMQILFQQYLNLPEYHQSSDGKIFGMLIPTKDGIQNLGKIKELYNKIKVITDETSQKYHVWSGISGNHRNKLVDYDNITNDLNVATIFSFICIFLILFNSFRSVRPIIVVIYPLVLGLLWSFAIVPLTFGSLNLITSFLAIILYGLGIDYPIHLVKRFQIEVQTKPVEEAMFITFFDTGLSVVMSALTTAAGFIIVVFSDFRGFFEYGILSSVAIIMILIAMYVALPPAIYLVWKHGGLKKYFIPKGKKKYIPNMPVTVGLVLLFAAGVYFTATGLRFDYFLSNTDFQRQTYSEINKINEKKNKVYSASMSPAAIYAASSLEQLDSINKVLNTAKQKKGSMINRVRSIRDFAPNNEEYSERKELITEMKEILQGDWTANIPDSNFKALIKDFLAWQMPDNAPTIAELPPLISDNLMGNKSSGYFLTTVYPTQERKDGRVAIAFSKELESLKMPASAKGPVGETMIFADVLNIVLSEAWWIVVFGQLLVFFVVIAIQRKFLQSIAMFIPLVGGLALTFGLFALLDFKITFFNVVCITALMGMGVDGGIHYINRWLVRGKDLQTTQNELYEPLYSAFLTVVFGYGGMIFSSHTGLRSMGLLSAIGMTLIMIANLVLLPGLLKPFSKKLKQQ